MHNESLIIRESTDEDWPAIWRILEPVFRAGETYAFDVDISEEESREAWYEKPVGTFVAERSGEIVGTYYLKPNQSGPGSHICNCGYIVDEMAQGQGVASRMCEHSQHVAVEHGFRGMQYNLVVSTNNHAIRLWEKHGFRIVGTLPGAFEHARLGFVDAHIMFKQLVTAP